VRFDFHHILGILFGLGLVALGVSPGLSADKRGVIARIDSPARMTPKNAIASPPAAVTAPATPATGGNATARRAGASSSVPQAVAPHAKPVTPPAEVVIKDTAKGPRLRSTISVVVNQETGNVLFAKNAQTRTPIASLTKLMTAMVTLDAALPMGKKITITKAEIDHIKGSYSRLRVGTVLSRRELLKLALMSSENRAACALGRTYPKGKAAFVAAMNRKAATLSMSSTHFVEPSGLSPRNVSTAADLVKMVEAAYEYPLIRQMTTTASWEVGVGKSSVPTPYRNTNRLVRKGTWDIGLSKTGFINEAGRCLVMQVTVANQPVIMVFLDADGKLSPLGDANRIRDWLEARRSG